MRNQPLIPDFHGSEVSGESLIDPPSESRFRSLALVFAAAAVIVFGRIVWVKANLQDRYLAALNTTSVEYEAIPARDGRILSESANVFATDVEQYSVQIHYRWLQNPIDEAWFGRQIRQRLTREERQSAAAVDELRKSLSNERQMLWQRLCDTVGIRFADFHVKRESIQRKVGRIAESVNRRRQQKRISEDSGDATDGAFMKLATSIRSSLTTAPQRTQLDRIVVREEESYHEIVSDVSLDLAGLIREQSHQFPGVRVVAGTRRTYPLESVASHVVGARTPAANDELPTTAAQDGSWARRIGRFGVERSYDHQLRSVPGLRRIVRNRRMELVESEIERAPVPGRDVLLTLNVELQRYAEQLLDEALLDRPRKLLSAFEDDESKASTPQPVPVGGSIVVMEAATGRVLTAASAPGFGLSLFAGASTADWNVANEDQRHPFLSRITAMALPPGSVVKPLTAVAAIESGGLNPDAPFSCQGYLRQPDSHRCLIFRMYGQGHSEITLPRAISQSCNVYFFSAAEQMGFGPLRQWCDLFGLGRPTGVDLPFEKSGNLPGTVVGASGLERSYRNEALGLAIGQSSLTATPLQVVRIMAAIANGGWLVTPHVVSPDGIAHTTTEIDDRPRDLSRRRLTGVSDDTLQRVREGLRAVVQEPYGTGYKSIRLDGVAIAGKTGTAETGGNKPDHAWFAGYVPADRPEYAFVVVLEHGGSGSRAAGPVARELVRKMLDLELW